MYIKYVRTAKAPCYTKNTNSKINIMPVQQKDIDAFLQLFGGDRDAAVAAIRKHTEDKQRHSSSAPSRPDSEAIIRVTDLHKSYKVKHQMITAVNGVSLTIYEGEFVALMGPSGSGKSTLLQLIGGLDAPTSGAITVDGSDLHRMSDRKLSEFRGKTLGFVFQSFYLQPFLRLGRNLEVPGIFAGTNPHERKARTQELSQIVGISERLDHYPKELSGGQIQRAAIVRALFNNPKVLLADEPTGNLDSKSSKSVIDLFENIRQKFGTTVIIATHDPDIANRADRIIRLKDGEIV
jgi:ABC-type lipoprotein export system ATPase subunit